MRNIYPESKNRQILLKVLLFMVIVCLIALIMQNFYKSQAIPIIKANQTTTAKKYIISEEMVLSKLKTRSQIVSLEQNLDKQDTLVDAKWLGERQTKLTIRGNFKMGLNTDDIEVRHIDSQTGIVCLRLGKPILISLDIPYDKIEFNKTEGFFRFSMNEKEKKEFYKATTDNIREELFKDKQLLKQADLLNKDTITNLLQVVPNVKGVIFE